MIIQASDPSRRRWVMRSRKITIAIAAAAGLTILGSIGVARAFNLGCVPIYANPWYHQTVIALIGLRKAGQIKTHQQCSLAASDAKKISQEGAASQGGPDLQKAAGSIAGRLGAG